MKRYLQGLLLIMLLSSGVPPAPAQVTADDFQYSSGIMDGLTSPTRVAVDLDDNIYVIDAHTREIKKYGMAGTLLETIATGGSPVSLAVDGSNQLYYGELPGGRIFKLNSNGQPVEFYSGCAFPNAMTFGPDQSLYISDSKLKKVLVINTSGQLVQSIGDGILSFPTGIAYDHKNHRLLVGEHGATEGSLQTRVYLFGTDGSLLNQLGYYGNGDGRFYRIQGVGSGRCGHIYVCDPFQGNVSVFKEDGTYLTKFGTFGTTPGTLNIPLDVSFTSSYDIILTSMNNNALEVYTIDDDLPSATIGNLELTICEGMTTDIPIAFTGAPPWSFTYTIDGANPATVSGVYDNPYLLSAGQEGTYVVTALTDANAEGHCFSGSARVHLTDAPTASIGTTTTTICEGSLLHVPVYLTGTPPWTITYSLDGTTVTSVTTATNPGFLSFSLPGTYEITALEDAFCQGTSFSGALTLVSEPRPEPDFTFNSHALSVSFINTSLHANAYMWNFGDNQVSTDANPQHHYQQAGFYTVRLIASNDYCKSFSILQEIEVRSGHDTASFDLPYADKRIDQPARDGFFDVALYPNPSAGAFTLQLSHPDGKEIFTELINTTGQAIYSEQLTLPHSGDPIVTGILQVRLPETAAGVYSLKVRSGEKSKTLRLVIQPFN